MLTRLLKNPHGAVFDTSPDEELALRLRHPGGAAWRIADEVLTVTVGNVIHVYELSTMTVAQLVTRLRADGFEVLDVSARFTGLQASVLVEGRNSQGNSNGDHLNGFTSLLWSLFGGYARELRTAKGQIPEALKQMVIQTAEGEWVDLWGTLYSVPRQGMTDAEYAEAIPREAFRIRLNARAIEKAILELTGKDVRIEEPWGSIFRLDESQLSGTSKFYDGSDVGYHLIRPVSTQSIDWDDVMAVIRRNIAAGVIILDPETRISRFVDASIDGTTYMGITSFSGGLAHMWTDSLLDYMKLSDEELVINYSVTISSLFSYSNLDPLLDPQSISSRHTFAKASIVLSEGPALGEENAVFPRYELVAGGKRMTLSVDAELSDIEQKPEYRPVDLITTSIHGIFADASSPTQQGGVQMVERLGYGSMNPVDGTVIVAGLGAHSSPLTITGSPVAASMSMFGNAVDPETGNDLVEVGGQINTYGGYYDVETLEVGP